MWPPSRHAFATGAILLHLHLLARAVDAKSKAAALPDITLFVRSQDTQHDRAYVQALEKSIASSKAAASASKSRQPNIHLKTMAEAEKELRHGGLWTYKPWIFLHEREVKTSKGSVPGGQRWLVMLEPRTAVNVDALTFALQQYDARQPHFLGRPIQDTELSIVHHYSREPPYPLLHAGFALSAALADLLVQDLEEHPLGSNQQIEPVWELAKWISGLGVGLLDCSDVFCVAPDRQEQKQCATWVRPQQRFLAGSALVPREDVIIAVKTVEHFHASRIPLIHELWGSSSEVPVVYLSNTAVADGLPETINLVDLSVEFGDAVSPEKESTAQGTGHCSKMQAILQFLWRHHSDKKWFVVTDDDTLLNVPALMQTLSAHDSDKPTYVGERYGWAHRESTSGSNYITTGGGMALTGPALKALALCDSCNCRSPNAPDDMSLGSWCGRLGIPILHEEGFHQSEPSNYHAQLLPISDAPVSFHRYGVRLPKSTSDEVLMKARREKWQQWKQDHFDRRGSNFLSSASSLEL